MNIFARITKVNEQNREVTGQIIAEVVDHSGEIFDYAKSKPHFEAWSADVAKASEGKSVGNLRAMHGNVAAGKLTELMFDDAAKQIDCVAKVVDDDEWKKVIEGVYTGFSLGGKYVSKWKDEPTGAKRYEAAPTEVSLVDMPCVPGSHFTVVKMDGATEEVAFQKVAAAPVESAEGAGDETPAATETSEESPAAAPSLFERMTQLIMEFPEVEAEQLASALAIEARKDDEDVQAIVGAAAGIVKVVRGTDLSKGLYEVSCLISIIRDLAYCTQATAVEAAMEKDGSAVPEQLKAALTQLAATLKDMVSEEVGELMAMYTAPIEVVTLANKPKDDEKLRKVLGVADDFAGSLADEVEKRLAASDLNKLAKVQGLLDETTTALAKQSKELTKLRAENEALSKKLADTPDPKQVKPVLRVVEKAIDMSTEAEPSVAPVKKGDGVTDDPVATAIKAAHSKGPMQVNK